MKQLKVTVNGKAYDVTVEEIGGSSDFNGANNTANASAPKSEPIAEAKSQSANSASAGSIKIESPMPGTILSVNVKKGDSVKKGDVLIILEALKMENEICAPNDGTVADVNVSTGNSVESGTLLLSLN